MVCLERKGWGMGGYVNISERERELFNRDVYNPAMFSSELYWNHAQVERKQDVEQLMREANEKEKNQSRKLAMER